LRGLRRWTKSSAAAFDPVSRCARRTRRSRHRPPTFLSANQRDHDPECRSDGPSATVPPLRRLEPAILPCDAYAMAAVEMDDDALAVGGLMVRKGSISRIPRVLLGTRSNRRIGGRSLPRWSARPFDRYGLANALPNGSCTG